VAFSAGGDAAGGLFDQQPLPRDWAAIFYPAIVVVRAYNRIVKGMASISVVFAIGVAVGFAVGYAVRAAISLRHRKAAMRRRYLL
jgi:hypothetical protein